MTARVLVADECGSTRKLVARGLRRLGFETDGILVKPVTVERLRSLLALQPAT
jgi:hypothetical protein